MSVKYILSYNRYLKMTGYRTILADPPWRYDNVRTGGSLKSGAASQYPTLTVDEVKQIPVQDICDRDAALFLWVTTPLKDKAIQVIDAWGFEYVTTIYWLKITKDGRPFNGIGFNARNCMEECLYARRGKVKPLYIQKPNVLIARPGPHSQKPDALYEFIEPALASQQLDPKIELFARRRRPGWDAWGNEVPDAPPLFIGTKFALPQHREE